MYESRFDCAKNNLRFSSANSLLAERIRTPGNCAAQFWKRSSQHEYHRFISRSFPFDMTVCYYCSDSMTTRVIAAESATTSKSTHSSSVYDLCSTLKHDQDCAYRDKKPNWHFSGLNILNYHRPALCWSAPVCEAHRVPARSQRLLHCYSLGRSAPSPYSARLAKI